ncbi:hypothetical protein A3K34_03940 [candidate division WWE3 bacterium RIFOXYC1_FULL_40_10]|uniref:Uncharacterized protein n=1 Tax=candidate division WWE3 bacterium RIFOXYA2_FULL_46_9 TaxID=1802636 RepID=A0A1F4W0N6_UNCKA|nr:MAG: hypothetical protein A3K58_03940 [candidate division WWE3 bacterium RIFOXYB1_FULL_40_22]OGC61992.1 MAG: hypothetical protein A3K37_03940 [candidate division WWE3 bacterium RIFOXYA1_FULL_40_11]OGC62910.1 MAG: hypothetical protein A2264_03460 [candidate division WWE3 bacterium RIFOXYA2_FULL_46_9]OGC65064.1 MAG: hypothetical protein A2326_03435 [candidate division WWE3 bacterium RIFOXYB2_FULL_41_6]OGC66375.1 MAG: hypothetical protein A3K34_03940 [candidate division WWE3 bacterium RIFOXYC1_
MKTEKKGRLMVASMFGTLVFILVAAVIVYSIQNALLINGTGPNAAINASAWILYSLIGIFSAFNIFGSLLLVSISKWENVTYKQAFWFGVYRGCIPTIKTLLNKY